MIIFENVSFSYKKGEPPIFRNLNCRIADGARLCLSAPSGSGKTTLLKLMMGLLTPTSGKIIGLPSHISAVFQEDRLIPGLTVFENVALFGKSIQQAKTILRDIGLGDVLEVYPDALSGGMKRRVAIARALVHPADLLILDEPANGLDTATLTQTLALINRESVGKTLLLASHQQAVAELLGCSTLALL